MKELIKEYGTLITSFLGGIIVIIMAYYLFKGGLGAKILLKLIEGAT